MKEILVPALYVMSGVCAYTALHHGLAVLRRRVNRIHLLFALMSLLTAALIMARAGAYGAHTVSELVAMRRWEIVFLCFFVPAFLWFVADYTGIRPRKLLFGLSGFWALLFAVNLALPSGVQIADSSSMAYFDLPWGERVADLRVIQRTVWHNLAWLGIVISLSYSLYACYLQYRRGQQRRARVMAWALSAFAVLSLLNVAINLKLVEFVHTSDFGFLALIVVMDMEMMLESRDQKRRLRAVLDHLPVAICLKDLKGHFQLINRKFESAFRTREGAIAGKKVFDLFPREQAAIIDANERHALDTRQDVESEEVLDCGGEARTFQSIKFPLLREDGSAYAVSSVYIDITESRQKDEALNRFRRQVWHADRVASTGAITSSLAHELCQPLAAMLSNAQAGLRFLAQDKVDLDEMREILQDIVRDDKRAGAVINGLRAMLQQQETPYADIDLGQCINEVIMLLHSEFVRTGVVVEHLLEANLAIRANKTQIQQVALNLMINALEAMAEQVPDQRMLRVTAARVDGKALVSIRDSGIGIAEDMLDRVFDGFYTTKPQGLGVGLEVCRSIMESHGGGIWAEANPDRGATFHFVLPLEDKTGT
ncbi:MAG: PAS domain-containing protein [Burkholderiales bacterium]|nr:PAS domain-containing protein [Burkholderiales bacterium]